MLSPKKGVTLIKKRDKVFKNFFNDGIYKHYWILLVITHIIFMLYLYKYALAPKYYPKK